MTSSEIINPATEELLRTVEQTDEAAVDDAVAGGKKKQKKRERMDPTKKEAGFFFLPPPETLQHVHPGFDPEGVITAALRCLR